MGCDLEVDVNGEEVFLVDKVVLCSYSGKLRKLFGKSRSTSNLKIIFHELPGGAEAFELMAQFCYNNGLVEVTPLNACLLHSIAHYMEMTEDVSPNNLIEQIEKSLEGIAFWSWADLLVLLKQCESLSPLANSSQLFQKCLDSVVLRITSASETSPSSSSPDSTGFRFSCDTRSSESTKLSLYRAWWFDDLVVFNSNIIEMLAKSMISHKLDHQTISRFLFYYLKSQVSCAENNEKCKATEIIVDLLFLLDRNSISCKGLFGVLRVVSNVNVNKCCKNKLENMIGSQLDQATLDNLLVPAPVGMGFLYDVNLVLRFLKSFLCSGFRASSSRLKRVGALMDMYIAEVAPDSRLKASKFIALAMALPDGARDSYDKIYRAVDMYLEVHSGLSEEDKVKICSVLNYEKLSTEVCRHLAQNPKLPPRTALEALMSQQSKLKNLLQDVDPLKPVHDTPCSFISKPTMEKAGNYDGDQVILYAKKLDQSTENENLKAHLQGMQWRVMELEKICRKMQVQMAKIMKSRLPSPGNPRSLPKLCS
ncbi:BTB/POZ domain-containing protein At3g22104-like [Aristolochia californica]|uniref:BTB/POZ domain-containing protein At3g22104-like n=1 Tax=Aristolochia californica TaxID=171875 RepID=UPI0035D7B6B5